MALTMETKDVALAVHDRHMAVWAQLLSGKQVSADAASVALKQWPAAPTLQASAGELA